MNMFRQRVRAPIGKSVSLMRMMSTKNAPIGGSQLKDRSGELVPMDVTFATRVMDNWQPLTCHDLF